jgi:hypothetical protein
MNWSARGNVLNQYLRNTSIGTTVAVHVNSTHPTYFGMKKAKRLSLRLIKKFIVIVRLKKNHPGERF